jgi:uncharacterized repeat protein (TIGR04076 family)
MVSRIKRRQFIRDVPAAVIGTVACPYLTGTDGVRNLPASPGSAGHSEARAAMEETVEKEIKHIEVKVASVKGTCGIHQVGDVARITEHGIDGKICIHALYSMLPAAFAMLYEARFPWLTANPDKKTHACPDAANPVVFEVTRVREG